MEPGKQTSKVFASGTACYSWLLKMAIEIHENGEIIDPHVLVLTNGWTSVKMWRFLWLFIIPKRWYQDGG